MVIGYLATGDTKCEHSPRTTHKFLLSGEKGRMRGVHIAVMVDRAHSHHHISHINTQKRNFKASPRRYGERFAQASQTKREVPALLLSTQIGLCINHSSEDREFRGSTSLNTFSHPIGTPHVQHIPLKHPTPSGAAAERRCCRKCSGGCVRTSPGNDPTPTPKRRPGTRCTRWSSPRQTSR